MTSLGINWNRFIDRLWIKILWFWQCLTITIPILLSNLLFLLFNILDISLHICKPRDSLRAGCWVNSFIITLVLWQLHWVLNLCFGLLGRSLTEWSSFAGSFLSTCFNFKILMGGLELSIINLNWVFWVRRQDYTWASLGKLSWILWDMVLILLSTVHFRISHHR